MRLFALFSKWFSMIAFIAYNGMASAAEMQPDAATTQDLGAQLIDIELPVQPGTNWWFGLEIGLAILVAMIVFGLLYWLRNRYWQRFRLSWQLNALHKLWQKQLIENTREEALKLYQVFDEAKKHHLLLEEDASSIKEALEPLCFSRSDASRETLDATLHHLQQSLDKHQKHQLKALPGNLLNQLHLALSYLSGKVAKKDQGEHHGR